MAPFNQEEIKQERLDWTILRDGGIYLYLREGFLLKDLKELTDFGYTSISFDCGTWKTSEQMHLSFQNLLRVPCDYYGKNLDALNDCIQKDIVVPDPGGMAIVLRNADRHPDREVLRKVLSIFARASRHHMLTGHRLITLIQTNNPRESFDSLACVGARWNHREWLIKARGL